MMSEADGKSPDARAASCIRYRCVKRAQMRVAIGLDSPKTGVLEPGDVILALEQKLDENGVTRIRSDMGWLSVRTAGGKTCLEPVAPEADRAIEEGTPSASRLGKAPGQTFRCIKKSRVRSSFEMNSTDTGILQVGTVIHALDSRRNQAGVLRIRFDRGWVSEVSTTGAVCMVDCAVVQRESVSNPSKCLGSSTSDTRTVARSSDDEGRSRSSVAEQVTNDKAARAQVVKERRAARRALKEQVVDLKAQGLAHFAAAEYEQTIKLLLEAKQLAPSDREVSEALAFARFANRKAHRDAQTCAQTTSQSNMPSSPAYWQQIALEHFSARRFADAVVAFEQALVLDPADVDVIEALKFARGQLVCADAFSKVVTAKKSSAETGTDRHKGPRQQQLTLAKPKPTSSSLAALEQLKCKGLEAFAAGHFKKAVEALAAAFALPPSDSEIKDALDFARGQMLSASMFAKMK